MAEQSNVENAQSTQGRYCIVCLDVDVTLSTNSDTTISICAFEQKSHCLDFIESQSNKSYIILIVSERIAQDIVPSIKDLSHVVNICIRCANGETNKQYQGFRKVRYIGPELSDFVGVIHNFQIRSELLDLIIETEERSTLTTSVPGPICDTSETEDSVDEQEASRSENILTRFTRDLSFFHQINKACRSSNPINDEDQHSIQQIGDALRRAQIIGPIKVFRGQSMPTEKLETLRKFVNGHLIFNSFFSTTTNYDVALMYSGAGTNTDGRVSVMYVIEGTYQPGMRPFAHLGKYASYPGEEQVLFMTRSEFRIDAIGPQDEKGLFIIHMTIARVGEE